MSKTADAAASNSDIDAYAEFTRTVAKYPGAMTGSDAELAYLALGLTGEAGEVANNVKKILRNLPGDNTPERRAKILGELSDVAWYWARLCEAMGARPSEVIAANAVKLQARLDAGKIGGDGDKR